MAAMPESFSSSSRDGVGLVVVAEVAFQVGDDLAGNIPGLLRILQVGFITSRSAMAALRICSAVALALVKSILGRKH
jgi:hypothetical protein